MHNCTCLSIVIMSFNANLGPNLKSSHSTEFCEISLSLSFTTRAGKQDVPEIGRTSYKPWCRCCRLKAERGGPIFRHFIYKLTVPQPEIKGGLIITPSLPHSIMNNRIKTKHKGSTTKASSSRLTKMLPSQLLLTFNGSSACICFALPPKKRNLPSLKDDLRSE